MTVLNFCKKNLVLTIGSIMLCFLLFMTFFGEYLPFIDGELQEIDYLWDENKIPVAPPYEPSAQFPLGTDRDGRDMLSLIVMGAKETLLIILSITLIRYLLAIPLAYFAHRQWLGANALLNGLNGFLSYVPTIIVVILLVTIPPLIMSAFRPYFVVLIIAAMEIGRVADMIKLEFHQISKKEFVTSGNSLGVSPFRLFKKYYLPFIYSKLLISIVGDLGKVMFLLGQLGFLGVFVAQVFVQVDAGVFTFENTSNSWPTFLSNAFKDIRGPVWIVFYPALAMTYVIFTFNMLGHGLQKIFR
ncbi:hypothetical protein J27TS8_41340 [Robertmurraya siralis]|uniref:ABC transmembrane type-1 domain-containing protein n=1 Tax=Robertmurraya siralis TaxID=77777 RepID=A0A919WLZ0_9BACI|nr:peptide ABC transporter permease [Robertmurraya siralis]GIN64141.1 hypothetical protein J27TS8_41340 [Robertmurraya siralis]